MGSYLNSVSTESALTNRGAYKRRSYEVRAFLCPDFGPWEGTQLSLTDPYSIYYKFLLAQDSS